MHNKTVNQIFDGHISPKKWIFAIWVFSMFEVAWFFKYRGGRKSAFPERCKMTFFTLFHPQLEFFNYLQKQKSYSHQGRTDWHHFWVKREISGGRKALRGTKNQKSCFLFFICMGHKYNISDFQPNRWHSRPLV